MFLAWLSTLAVAHDYILDTLPDTLEGTPIQGVLANGPAREVRPSRPSSLVRLDRVVGTEVTPLPPARTGWGVVVGAPDVVTAVVYENAGATVELPRDRFRKYLATEGDRRRLPILDGLAPGAQRERYRRSLKLLLGVDGDREGWDRVLGMPLELVLLDRPGSTRTMRVKLLEAGVPVAGAAVRAYPLAMDTGGHSVGDETEAITGPDGVATLSLARAGTDWVYAAVTMTYDPARPEPWHSLWTTLRTR